MTQRRFPIVFSCVSFSFLLFLFFLKLVACSHRLSGAPRLFDSHTSAVTLPSPPQNPIRVHTKTHTHTYTQHLVVVPLWHANKPIAMTSANTFLYRCAEEAPPVVFCFLSSRLSMVLKHHYICLKCRLFCPPVPYPPFYIRTRRSEAKEGGM